jgi:hypothetical protein
LKFFAEQRANEAAGRHADNVHRKRRSAKPRKPRSDSAENHFSNEYFKRADRQKPGLGRRKLMQVARRLASDDGMDWRKKREMTEDRARRYINRTRGK